MSNDHPDDPPTGRTPRRLSDLMVPVLRRTLGDVEPTAVDLFGKWAEIVGAAVAENVIPRRLEKRVLTVEVVDPAWATQMRFLEKNLLATLSEHVGDVVDSITVTVRRSRG